MTSVTFFFLDSYDLSDELKMNLIFSSNPCFFFEKSFLLTETTHHITHTFMSSLKTGQKRVKHGMKADWFK